MTNLHPLFQQILRPFGMIPTTDMQSIVDAVEPLIARSREIADCGSDIMAGQVSVYDSDYLKMVRVAEDALSKAKEATK